MPGMRYRRTMDAQDIDGIDEKLKLERQWLCSSLRWIANRLDSLSTEDVVEPLTMLADPAEELIRRAQQLLKVRPDVPPPRPSN